MSLASVGMSSVEVNFHALTVKQLSGGIDLNSLNSEESKSQEFTLVYKRYQVESEYYRVHEEDEAKEYGFRRQADASKGLYLLNTSQVTRDINFL